MNVGAHCINLVQALHKKFRVHKVLASQCIATGELTVKYGLQLPSSEIGTHVPNSLGVHKLWSQYEAFVRANEELCLANKEPLYVKQSNGCNFCNTPSLY